MNQDYVRHLLEQNRLTERDELLLRCLDVTPVMSSRQIKRMFWADSTLSNLHRRLRQLYDYYLLDRTRMLNKQEGITYTLGKAGRIWLHSEARGGGGPMVNVETLAHDLAVAEVMVLVTEELRRADPDGRLGLRLEWHSEDQVRVINKDKVLVEPDAGFRATAGDQRYYRFYLEIDRATERGPAIQAKVRRYYQAAQGGLLEDLPAVMVITTSGERASNIARIIADHPKSAKPTLLWLVTTLPELQKMGLFNPDHRWYVIQYNQVGQNSLRAVWA